jgi:hypothetical protein
MTERTIDRVELLAEALEIEKAGGQWKVPHVMAVLDCARSTIYNTPWLLRTCKRIGKRGRRWVPADVRRGPTVLKQTGS